MLSRGTRILVYRGKARRTTGGLTKSQLFRNKWGRIVSRKLHFRAKKEKRLQRAGYVTRKGHFGAIYMGQGQTRGGAAPLQPHPYHGSSGPGSGVALQFVAGNAA
jgi:hypothetical protein